MQTCDNWCLIYENYVLKLTLALTIQLSEFEHFEPV